MITILCWLMAIGAMLAYASPIVAVLLMHYHEKRKHTCAICGKKQESIAVCHDCLDEGI